jgi:GR25 family glycosyltransferase involved in LPS biosynthesis
MNKTILIYIDVEDKPNHSFSSFFDFLQIHKNDNCILILQKNNQHKQLWKQYIIKYLFDIYHIWFVYQYPNSITIQQCISHMVLFTNIDTYIYFICYSKWNDIKKIRKKESLYYIEMNDIKLRCITSNYLQYEIYDKYKRTFEKIIEIKRKTIQKQMKESWKRKYERYLLLNEYINQSIQIKYVVINLKEREDRYERFQLEIQKIGIEVERFEGIQTNYEEYPYQKRRIHNERYTNSFIGCKWSHIQLLESYQNHKEYDYLCIFEDDMKCREIEDIIKRILISIQTFSQYDGNILYLGVTNKNERDIYEKPIYLLDENEGLSTVGYIVPTNKIEFILHELYHKEEEIDVIYSKYISKRYLMEPNIIIQHEDYSNILHKNVNYNEHYL